LTEERFDSLAPNFVLDFFKDFMVTTGNMCVAGETGTGKTELSKLVLGYVPNEDRIVSIQDVNELHLSKLYPGRNIMNWLTKEKKFTIADGVKASLRANPKWIVVAETRGAEAWELLQATLTGHFMITTLHANSALMIPRRFVSMAKTAVDIDEGLLMEDILTNFDLGAFIKRITYVDRHGNGHTIRYLAELVEYGVDKSRMLFKQEFRRGQFYVTSGQEQISEGLARRMEEVDLEPFQFPVLDNEPITKACIEAWNKESNTEQQEKDMAILDEVMTS
jgi:pilus assembly protein CpaF